MISAISRILLKKGLDGSNPLTGMTVSIYIGFVFLGTLAAPRLFRNEISWDGLWVFAAIGVVAPPLVRLLTYIGVDRLGAANAEPLRSTQPFFALLLGSLLLRESVSLWNWLASFGIFTGIYLLSRNSRQGGAKGFAKADLLYPLAAAVVAGVITVARKYGVTIAGDPVLGAFVAASSAVVVYSIFLLSTGRHRRLQFNRRSNLFFFAAGCLTGITDILDLYALHVSSVKIVAPLLGVTPLFVIGLSTVFLKDQENVTKNTWIAAALIIVSIQLLLFGAS